MITPIDDKTINRLAQYLYEEIQKEEGIQLVMNMTGKPELVAALKRAIERTQEEAAKDFQEALAKVREAWDAAGAAISQAFKDATKTIKPEDKP